MNNFLNFSFIPFLLCGAIRYVVADAAGVHPLDIRTFNQWELWLYGICLILLCASIWHHFFRAQCPRGNCRSYNIVYRGEKEHNQVHRIKKVTERDNNGKSVTRSLNVTIAQLHHYYICKDCGYEWITNSEREK